MLAQGRQNVRATFPNGNLEFNVLEHCLPHMSDERLKEIVTYLPWSKPLTPRFLHVFQSLQQGEQGKNAPNTPPSTVTSTSSMPMRNQNHITEHLPITVPPNNHHSAVGSNSGAHRFHPYNRHDGSSSQGGAQAKVDASRDPRLKLRGNNGAANGNGNVGSFMPAPSNGNNGHHNSDLSVRNVINTSRDPRTRRWYRL